MKQSLSWEANRFSASEEIPLILCNPKIHYRFTSVLHLALSWATSIQSMSPSHFLKSILILSSHLRLGRPSGLFPSGFPPKTCVHYKREAVVYNYGSLQFRCSHCSLTVTSCAYGLNSFWCITVLFWTEWWYKNWLWRGIYWNIQRHLLQHSETFTETFRDIYCNIQRHLLKHSETFTATFRDIYCNIQRYLLQHSETFTATFSEPRC